MGKSKKQKKPAKAKKTAQELHELTTDETMRHIFGPEGHKLLKEQVVTHDKPKAKDWKNKNWKADERT
jgi:hypothetical protein